MTRSVALAARIAELLPPTAVARLQRIAIERRMRYLPSEPLRRSLQASDVRVRAAISGSKLTGYAAVFNSLSVPTTDDWATGYRESLVPGSFAQSLASGREIVALFNHDRNIVLASTRTGSLRLWEDQTGLAFEMTPLDCATTRDYILPSVRDGRISAMSFSYRPVRDTWSSDRKTHTVFEAELLEVSPVVHPAFPATSVTVIDGVSRSLKLRTSSAIGSGFQSPEQRRTAALKAWRCAVEDAPAEAARRAAIIAEHQRRIRERENRWAQAGSLVSLRGF